MRYRPVLEEPVHFGVLNNMGSFRISCLLGKALGGGLPLGAFIASKTLMDAFTGTSRYWVISLHSAVIR